MKLIQDKCQESNIRHLFELIVAIAVCLRYMNNFFGLKTVI